MAEVVPYPNREINDEQKQIFVRAFMQLEPYILLDTPTPEALTVLVEDYNSEIEIYKWGKFTKDGKQITLESFEVIEDKKDEEATSLLWSVSVESITEIADITLAESNIYLVTTSDAGWDAEFEMSTTSRSPTDRSAKRCPSGFEIELQKFWESKPSVAEQEARLEIIEKEMEHNNSDVPLEYRFTQQRMAEVLLLLVQLGPEHRS